MQSLGLESAAPQSHLSDNASEGSGTMKHISRWATAIAGAFLSACECGGRSQVETRHGELGVVFHVDGSARIGREAVYDFGWVFEGEARRLELEVRNLGQGPLGLFGLEWESGDPVSTRQELVADAPFAVAFEPREIPQGESARFALWYHPRRSGLEPVAPSHQAQLILRASNAEAGLETARITLRGQAVEKACEPPPPIEYSPARGGWVLDFAAVAVGETFSHVIELENTTPVGTTAFLSEPYSSTGDHLAFTPSPQGRVRVPSGGRSSVALKFAPMESRPYEAFVSLRVHAACPVQEVLLKGAGVESVLTWAPPSLEFGYVTPGATVVRELTFSNAGLTDVTVNGLRVEHDASFALEGGPTSLTVPGRTTRTVRVSFAPKTLGRKQAGLLFETALPKQPQGAVPLRGYGGGPDVEVRPFPTLSFGRMAYFPNADPPPFQTRRLTVMNVGSKPGNGDPNGNLRLGDSSGKLFDVRPLQGGAEASEISVLVPPSYDPAVGLEATPGKNLVELSVKVTPNGVGQKSWALTLYTNDADEPTVTVTVRADVATMPPCRYAVTPMALDFGLLTPPQSRDMSFRVKNLGQMPGELCLLSFDMQAGSDSTFSLPDGPVQSAELQPNEEYEVTVRAYRAGPGPQGVMNVTGGVELFVSSPVQPQRVVSLSATAALGCLSVSPDDLDFGTVRRGCGSATATFNIYNVCPAPVTIRSFELPSAAGQPVGGPECAAPASGHSFCPEFFLGTVPPIPAGGLVVPPGATPLSFTAAYRPIDIGADAGAVAVAATENGQDVVYVVALQGNADEAGLNIDTFTQDRKPKADLLLVIDDSCSMIDEQLNLANNFAAFIDYVNETDVDYHIAVTTTDMQLGGAQGRFVWGPFHPDKVLTPGTPNVEEQFRAKVNVGVRSLFEECFRPALTALTPPLSVTENAGFLRSDASLAIVCISDELEQSPGPVAYWFDQLRNIKGLRQANLFSLSAIAGFVDPAPFGCNYAPDDGRYAQMVQLTNGVRENICTPDWATTLQQLGKTAFGFRTDFFLNATPDLTGGKGITVRIDGRDVAPSNGSATVWTYDPVANAVRFTPAAAPRPGQLLEIVYQVACL